MSHIFCIVYIGKRVPVNHNQVSQFALFQRSDMVAHADIPGAVDGGHFQSIMVAHAPLGKHPELPVGCQSLKLSVSPNIDQNSAVVKLFGAAALWKCPRSYSSSGIMIR